jgi:hypothetical protein
MERAAILAPNDSLAPGALHAHTMAGTPLRIASSLPQALTLAAAEGV